MKVRSLILVLVFVAEASIASAQNAVPYILEFQPVFGKEKIKCDGSWFQFNGGDSIQPEALRFYISGIEFWEDEKTVWKEDSGFHLIDLSVTKSLKIVLNCNEAAKFNKIKFNLGIDSITNVSGAMGGDLDPARGMYWTWQSGYINVKFEGKSNRCKSRNHEFQYHLGGYQYPDNALRTAVLEAGQTSGAVIILDIKQFISETDLASPDHIMSPGMPAMELSDKLIKAFSIQ